MSETIALPLTQADALQLHQRLLTDDPTASADFAAAYLDSLIAWLSTKAPKVSEDHRNQAAEEAILSLIRNPHSYSPDKKTLEGYLQMSAQGDLRNILRSERKHLEGRISLRTVELSGDAGKYLGREDDPSLGLRLAEEEQAREKALPASVRRKLSEQDLRAVELILNGEGKTQVFAELYGLLELPEKERCKIVKQHKDRLKKILTRHGGRP